MYVVAEEDNGESAGTVVIVSSNWLTPKKTEAYWPPLKTQAKFNKLLKQHEYPNPKEWAVIKLKRNFFECDDLLIARKKAQDAEINSDLTDGEICAKRKRYRSKAFASPSSSSEDEDVFNKHKTRKTIFENPVRIIFESPFEVGAKPQVKFRTKYTGNRELNASLHEGNSPPRFETSRPSSPALPAELSGTCELNGIHQGSRDGGNSKHTAASIIAASPTSTTISAAKSAYDYNVMQMLTTIKEQNTVILEWIRKQNAKEFQFNKKRNLQLPVEFPLNDHEQLLQLEIFLASNQNFTDLCEYFGEFAGPTVTGTVNSILKHTLTNHLAATYSFRGKKGKRAFEDLTLKTTIIRAVKKIFNVVRDQPIEDDMKVWLKHAPQRIILQEKKIRARLDRTA